MIIFRIKLRQTQKVLAFQTLILALVLAVLRPQALHLQIDLIELSDEPADFGRHLVLRLAVPLLHVRVQAHCARDLLAHQHHQLLVRVGGVLVEARARGTPQLHDLDLVVQHF